MSLGELVLRNLKKNLRHYYLYVFALVFSVALYFAFVTLQYDPAMDEVSGSVKGAAGLKSASVLLLAIVAIFLFYANNIFIKRRGREIGLFQLIGLTKGSIFRMIGAENLILYFGSLLIGIFAGFSSSRLLLMILFEIMGVDASASLNFSFQALRQTLIVFATLYVLIMLANFIYIRRQSILSLFRTTSTTENSIRKIPVTEIIFGLLGIVLITSGYIVSGKLFSGDYATANELFMTMIFILGSVIIGTYLLYKGSVSLIFNAVRRSKGGYLSLSEVLSLSSIMFRMKSNALLLTIITTVSALAIGLLSLSYISYYSADKMAKQTTPNHFSVPSEKDAVSFTAALGTKGIPYKEVTRPLLIADSDISDIVDNAILVQNGGTTHLAVVSDQSVEGVDVSPSEARFMGSSDAVRQFMGIGSEGRLVLKGRTLSIPLTLTGSSKRTVLSINYTEGMPSAVVDDAVFRQLAGDLDPALQPDGRMYIGIDIKDPALLDQADAVFRSQGFASREGYYSQPESRASQRELMGLVMFIVGFLGLTFLITSGCILYFKQMDEGEEEKPNYTILRKLGFTQGNLLRGIQFKQLFNFGIPLLVGLSHSYFAVKSGWFFFGTEMWTPMVLVMLLYTALYSVFGLLSVLFYRRVIAESL